MAIDSTAAASASTQLGMQDLLKVLLAANAEAHGVAPKLLANAEDIDRLATEDHPDIAALHGWRFELYGRDALALKSGERALAVDGRKIVLVARPS